MRVTRVFKRLLGLRGERVVGVELVEAPKPRLVVEVALPVRRRLVCGRCGQLCGSVYDHRRQAWRDLDAVTTSVWITCRIARVACPDCGVVAEAVSWARPQARFTRRFEDTCAWLLQQASRRAVAALLGVDWETVGRITSRVVNEQRHRYGDGLDGLRRIGIDEVAYRRGYRYLTVVCCHDTGRVVWVAPGRHRATIERFFGELGPQRSAALEAVSLDLSQSYQQAVRRHAPNAAVCADPFHVAKKALFALDRLRSRHWQRLRRDDPLTARWLKSARFAVRRRADQRTASDQRLIDELAHANQPIYHAMLWCDQLRALITSADPDTVAPLLATLSSEARTLKHPLFTRLADTLTRHAEQITNSRRYQLTNARLEALNSSIRLLNHRARGYRRLDHLINHIHLTLGRIHIELPT